LVAPLVLVMSGQPAKKPAARGYGLLGVFNQAQASEVVSMVERVNQYAEAV